MTAETAAPRHVFSTVIQAAPEMVWRALTESEFTARYWYGATAHSDWQTGSPYEYRNGDQPAIKGVVKESDPPRRLALSYYSPYMGTTEEQASDLTFEITDEAPGTVKLTVIHENVAPSDMQIVKAEAGWPFIIANLKAVLETGEPLKPAWG